MKIIFKNCGTETLYSLGTGAFIVIIVELEYHIAISEKYNAKRYHNNFMRQEGLYHQWKKYFFSERTRFFPIRQQERRKISLFSEIRVSRKGQMFLKYQNKQWKPAIWPLIFMFDRKFPSITDFLFLFHPTKRWKISNQIIVLAVVILSRSQCITRVVW